MGRSRNESLFVARSHVRNIGQHGTPKLSGDVTTLLYYVSTLLYYESTLLYNVSTLLYDVSTLLYYAVILLYYV